MYRSKYRILGQIGQGQFGRVFCAVHRETGDLVALKDLDRERFPTRVFLRELSCLTTLRHPNIVTCQGLDYSPTGRYLVMDYCEGGTLRDLIEGEDRLNLVRALKLIEEILLGLDYAHGRDIIHCDIKPENILLSLNSRGWTARISDFGIAQLSQETGSKTIGRGYTGSPAYMAPERFYGQYSPASDLYAVGVMLFELVTGERPFSGIPAQIMSAHLNQRVAIPDTVPFILRSTIYTALQKLPQKRFRSAAEMLDSVRLAMEVISAEQSSSDFFVLSALDTVCPLEIIDRQSLSDPVTHLAIEEKQVYLGMGDRLECRMYADPSLMGDPIERWQIKFDSPLVSLGSQAEGNFVITQSQENCSIYKLSKSTLDLISCLSSAEEEDGTTPVPLLSFSSTKLAIAIAPQKTWLTLAMQSEFANDVATFEILKLPHFQSVRSLIETSFPSHLAILDNRHGLAIFPTDNQHTVFRFFDRRGHSIDGFSLPLVLKQVVANPNFPYRLLAIEQQEKPSALAIDLKPLKVRRIPLDIAPDFIVPYGEDYLLADRRGRIVLLDETGESIAKFDLSLPITALSIFDRDKLAIATWSDKQGSLYTVDLEKSRQQLSSNPASEAAEFLMSR